MCSVRLRSQTSAHLAIRGIQMGWAWLPLSGDRDFTLGPGVWSPCVTSLASAKTLALPRGLWILRRRQGHEAVFNMRDSGDSGRETGFARFSQLAILSSLPNVLHSGNPTTRAIGVVDTASQRSVSAETTLTIMLTHIASRRICKLDLRQNRLVNLRPTLAHRRCNVESLWLRCD